MDLTNARTLHDRASLIAATRRAISTFQATTAIRSAASALDADRRV